MNWFREKLYSEKTRIARRMGFWLVHRKILLMAYGILDILLSTAFTMLDLVDIEVDLTCQCRCIPIAVGDFNYSDILRDLYHWQLWLVHTSSRRFKVQNLVYRMILGEPIRILWLISHEEVSSQVRTLIVHTFYDTSESLFFFRLISLAYEFEGFYSEWKYLIRSFYALMKL